MASPAMPSVGCATRVSVDGGLRGPCARRAVNAAGGKSTSAQRSPVTRRSSSHGKATNSSASMPARWLPWPGVEETRARLVVAERRGPAHEHAGGQIAAGPQRRELGREVGEVVGDDRGLDAAATGLRDGAGEVAELVSLPPAGRCASDLGRRGRSSATARRRPPTSARGTGAARPATA